MMNIPPITGKRITTVFALFFACFFLMAQDPSAIFDVESTSKGVLLPRMTTSQRLAISNPSTGLTVYDVDTRTYWYSHGSTWFEINRFARPYDIGGTNTSNLAIPDEHYVMSTITLLHDGSLTPITSIEVCLNIDHDFIADLDLALISPDGTDTIDLSSDNGGGGQNYENTCFSTDATKLITDGTPPFTGQFKPEGGYSSIVDQTINGTWTLLISDDSGGDEGMLLDWSIRFIQPKVFEQAYGNVDVQFYSGLSVDSVVTFDDQIQLGSLNNGYSGDSTQLLLSGQHDVGVNAGPGTMKLRIDGYDNDGTVVYPIYVHDEDGNVDFYLKNKPSVSGLSSAYFAGNVGIGTMTPQARLDVRSGAGGVTSDWAAANIGHAVGDRLLIGTYNGRATIASKNNDLSDWSDLVVSFDGGKVGVGVESITTSPDIFLHTAGGHIYIEGVDNSIILSSPDGNCHKVVIGNDGSLSTEPVSCQ